MKNQSTQEDTNNMRDHQQLPMRSGNMRISLKSDMGKMLLKVKVMTVYSEGHKLAAYKPNGIKT